MHSERAYPPPTHSTPITSINHEVSQSYSETGHKIIKSQHTKSIQKPSQEPIQQPIQQPVQQPIQPSIQQSNSTIQQLIQPQKRSTVTNAPQPPTQAVLQNILSSPRNDNNTNTGQQQHIKQTFIVVPGKIETKETTHRGLFDEMGGRFCIW